MNAPSPILVLTIVCDELGADLMDVVGRERVKSTIEARRVCALMLSELCGRDSVAIASWLLRSRQSVMDLLRRRRGPDKGKSPVTTHHALLMRIADRILVASEPTRKAAAAA